MKSDITFLNADGNLAGKIGEFLSKPENQDAIKDLGTTGFEWLKSKKEGKTPPPIILPQTQLNKIAKHIQEIEAKKMDATPLHTLLESMGYYAKDGLAIKGTKPIDDAVDGMKTSKTLFIIGGSLIGGALLIWGIVSLVKKSKK